MKIAPRTKLSIAILFVVLYMIAAFVWWTISLTNYSARERDLKVQLFRSDSLHLAGDILHNMFSGKYKGPDSMRFVYRGEQMYVDTTALLKALLPKYPYYDVTFHPNKPFDQIASVRIKPALLAKEDGKYRRKVESWIYEGIVMTIILLLLALALYIFLDRVLRINQQQNNFLLAVTHELKTPVASTKLAVQTAQRKVKNSDEQLSKLLSMADNNMSRLTKIIDNVLMATRVQSITVKKVVQDLVLEELINDIVLDIKPSLPQTAQIECHFMPDLIIRGDRELLQMAISNLISNAVKYSPEGNEKVIVKTFIQKGKAAMSITDFGPGIPEKERKNIFKMFYRIGDERTRSSAGTGLGLFLVQGILRQHSAIISVNHNIPVGSSFCIIFKEKASL